MDASLAGEAARRQPSGASNDGQAGATASATIDEDDEGVPSKISHGFHGREKVTSSLSLLLLRFGRKL